MYKATESLLPKLNLQLFGEDEEELESGGLEQEPEDELDDVEDEFEPEEDELEDDVEDDTDEDEDNHLDKKTKAIIKHKKENKELRRKLQELEEEKQAAELEGEKSQRVVELTKQGKSHAEATKMAEGEVEVKKLRLQIARLDIEKLENKYPGISLYSKDLSQDKAKLPEFSYEQLYLAKYANKSKYDEKTRLEQEFMRKTKDAKGKSLEAGSNNKTKQVRLSKEDERVYNYMKQSRPNLTRKKFLELMEGSLE